MVPHAGTRPAWGCALILIGQYDSPFVRRVAVALRLYDMAYEHRPWSVFRDAAEVRRFNPLIRVPTLVLDDGEALIESFAILDHLDQQAAASKLLIAPAGAARGAALQGCALATGLAEKAVGLLYERVMHQPVSQTWTERCTTQVLSVLDALEMEVGGSKTIFWFGDTIGHADIALACALHFIAQAHPDLRDDLRRPKLAAHAARCEALLPFRQTAPDFLPPGA